MIGLGRKRKSLSGILSTFTKTIKDLEVLISKNNEKVDANNLEVLKLQNQIGDLSSESDKAAKVRAKITELVS